jgi:hypothetical protein
MYHHFHPLLGIRRIIPTTRIEKYKYEAGFRVKKAIFLGPDVLPF